MSNESQESRETKVLLGVATLQEIAVLVPTNAETAGITPPANVSPSGPTNEVPATTSEASAPPKEPMDKK